MGETKFYVEKPGDRDGNISMPLAVVEAQLTQGGPEVAPLTNPNRPAMIPVAPPEIVTRWRSGWYEDAYGGWMETEGPARLITRAEWEAITGWSDPRQP